MWTEPSPRWELFAGQNQAREPRSRIDALIALSFVLSVVAVGLTALGWLMMRTGALQPFLQLLQSLDGGMGGG